MMISQVLNAHSFFDYGVAIQAKRQSLFDSAFDVLKYMRASRSTHNLFTPYCINGIRAKIYIEVPSLPAVAPLSGREP